MPVFIPLALILAGFIVAMFLIASKLVFCVLVVLSWFSIIGLAALGESKTWNHGTCRESGLPWRYFGSDSQGGRGYKDDAGHTCWISYPLVDRSRYER